jgi:hypothetical protein
MNVRRSPPGSSRDALQKTRSPKRHASKTSQGGCAFEEFRMRARRNPQGLEEIRNTHSQHFDDQAFTALSMHLIKSFISKGFPSRHAAPATAALAARLAFERAVINTTGVVDP